MLNAGHSSSKHCEHIQDHRRWEAFVASRAVETASVMLKGKQGCCRAWNHLFVCLYGKSRLRGIKSAFEKIEAKRMKVGIKDSV